MHETFEGPRGLVGYIRLTTDRNDVVEVQESSAVEHSAWLRLNGECAHIRYDDVKALRDALNNYLGDI